MAQSLDILYVITKATWGGAQRYVFDLASAMKAEGRTVAVAYGEPGLLVEKLEALGIRAIPVPALGRDVRVGKDLAAYRALITLFTHEQPRVVHLNSSKAGGLGAFAARRARIERIIFTAHGWAWNEKRSFLSRILIRLVAYVTVLLSHTTICVSEAMRRDAGWMPGAQSRLVTIRNAIDAPVFLSRNEARAYFKDATKAGTWIGMISELHPTKRVEDSIRAVALLSPEYPDLSLIVLGEGEERRALEALIKEAGLESRVLLPGFVPDAARYLRAFDLFVHTSRSESFGFAVAEAGLAGLPVIATNVGAIPELVEHGETGTLVPCGNPKALARAVARYLSSPEKARSHGEALASRMPEKVSTKRMVQETAALY